MLRVNDVCFSRAGLWILSGQACGGICGPRFRWEEEQLEAKHAVYDPDTEQAYYTRGYPAPDNSSGIMSTWGWRECTRARIQEAFEFCLVLPLSTTRATRKLANESMIEKKESRMAKRRLRGSNVSSRLLVSLVVIRLLHLVVVH